jgi:hypothetical protein
MRVVGPMDGDKIFLGSIGVRFMIAGAETGGRFAFLEHPMSPRALAAPLHRHSRDEPCRILEIISPAGFEQYFTELAALGGPLKATREQFAQLVQRYGFESRPETIPELLQRFGLRMGEPLAGGWTP